MEGIVYERRRASEAEKAALHTAVGELIDEERSAPEGWSPRKRVIEFYQTFMKNLGLEE